MARTDPTASDDSASTYARYVLDVEIVEYHPAETDGPRYSVETPRHRGVEFENPELAELYVDVYFDVNGFVEEGTGERGVPPEVIQGGRDTLAAYFLTQSGVDRNWVASFLGRDPSKIERYVESVRERAEEIRRRIRDEVAD